MSTPIDLERARELLATALDQTDRAIEVARVYRASLEKAVAEIIGLRRGVADARSLGFNQAREYFADLVATHVCEHTDGLALCCACAANLILVSL